MKTELKKGDQVRLKGAPEIGTVAELRADGTVRVEYPHPGRTTIGIYPLPHLEAVPDPRQTELAAELIAPTASVPLDRNAPPAPKGFFNKP